MPTDSCTLAPYDSNVYSGSFNKYILAPTRKCTPANHSFVTQVISTEGKLGSRAAQGGGFVCSSTFKDGQQDGPCTMVKFDDAKKIESVVTGHFVNYVLTGDGVCMFYKEQKSKSGFRVARQGDVFHGKFVRNKQIGAGQMIRANKSVETGEFEDYQLHGKGVETHTDGKVFTGTYVRGRRMGHGVLKYPCGRTYAGHFDGVGIKGSYTITHPDVTDKDAAELLLLISKTSAF